MGSVKAVQNGQQAKFITSLLSTFAKSSSLNSLHSAQSATTAFTLAKSLNSRMNGVTGFHVTAAVGKTNAVTAVGAGNLISGPPMP